MFEIEVVERLPEELFLPPGWMPSPADLTPDDPALFDPALFDPALFDPALFDEAGLFDEHGFVPAKRAVLEKPPPCLPGAHLPPSGWSAVALDEATADAVRLSDAQLVDAVIGFERITGWAQARQARLLAEFARRRPGDDRDAAGTDRCGALSRYAPDEIGLALRLSRLTAKYRLARSAQLLQYLPRTLELWEGGHLDERKVALICETVLRLEPDQAGQVEDRILGRAPEQTLSQLRSALARAVIAVDAEGANRRHREARKDRRVCVGEENDGMSSLWALLPAHHATASYEWLTRLARSLGQDDPRGMDARRADLMVNLLTGRLAITDADDTGGTGTPGPGSAAATTSTRTDTPEDSPSDEDAGTGARSPDAHRGPATTPTGTGRDSERADPRPPPATPGKPLIHVLMPYSTLVGAQDEPCELTGYGPIPPDVAREIAADAVWKRLVTDPLSGALLDHGRTTYRPPPALADVVRGRDVECRSPICRRRALNCELDHVHDWDHGGCTVDTNLWAGCPHDHHLKHDDGWTVTLNPDASMTWTTPTGHTYRSEPWDYRPDPSTATGARRATTTSAGQPTAPTRARHDWSRPEFGDDPPPF